MELRKEIMAIYKNPNTNLKVQPKIRFEEEEGQIECQISAGVDNDRNLLFNSCRWEVVERNVFSLRGK